MVPADVCPEMADNAVMRVYTLPLSRRHSDPTAVIATTGPVDTYRMLLYDTDDTVYNIDAQ